MTTVVDMDGGTTVIASLGDTGTVFVSTPMGGGSAGGASIMADISDKQGKVLDDLIEIENLDDADTIFAVGGYIFKENDDNSFFAGGTMLVSANGGVVSQLISAPIVGKIALRRYEAGVWGDMSFTIAPYDVQLWYSSTTASAADAVINADGTFSREVSTIEWKRDIEPMQDEYADAIVQGVETIYYRSKCERDPQDWGYWGIPAEQLAEIDPRLVHWGHSTKEVAQPFGAPKTVPDLDSPLKPVGVQYSRLVVPLLQVVKRQSAAIEALTARLEALEAKP